MTKTTAELELCYKCEEPLEVGQDVYCAKCEREILADWDPSDDEILRWEGYRQRGYAALAAWIAGAAAGLLVLIVVLALFAHDARAQSLTVTRTHHGHPYRWTLPEAGCNLIRWFDDGNAQAWCPSGMMDYDPEDKAWYAVETTR